MTFKLSNPGNALSFTKGDRRKGVAPKPILPTPHEVTMLRRVALGYAKVTFTDKGPQYAYDCGTPLPLRASPKDPNGSRQFQRMVSNGWLIPDKGDSLWDGAAPQVYRARRP